MAKGNTGPESTAATLPAGQSRTTQLLVVTHEGEPLGELLPMPNVAFERLLELFNGHGVRILRRPASTAAKAADEPPAAD